MATKNLQEDNRIFFRELDTFLTHYKRYMEGPPKVDIEDKDHIYLLDSKGKRKHRICGRHLRNMPSVFLCKNYAGANTDHKGVGPCQIHEFKGSEIAVRQRAHKLWSMFNEENGTPTNLAQMIERAKSIDQTVLSTVDPDIKILYSMLSFTINKSEEKGQFNKEDVKLVASLVHKIANLKKLKKDMEMESKMDMQSIVEFTRGIFSVITRETSNVMSQQLMASILKEVIKPLKEKNMVIEDADYTVLDFLPDELKKGSDKTNAD